MATNRSTQARHGIVGALVGGGLVAAGLGAAPAGATAPGVPLPLHLDHPSGTSGTAVLRVSGEGCGAFNPADGHYYPGRAFVAVTNARTGVWADAAGDASGSWTVPVTFPAGASLGTYQVTATCYGAYRSSGSVQTGFIQYYTPTSYQLLPPRPGSQY